MRAAGAWLRDTAGGLPAVFWFLWSGLLINRVGAFAMLFLPLYLTDARGASDALAGLVVGAYGLGGVAGVLLGGVLADRWGRRRTLVWSHLAASALMASMAMVASLPAIALLAALVGIAHSMPGPAFVAAIVDVVPAPRRSRAFNLQFWAFNLGMAGASALAGLLAEASYLALFLVDAAATVITTVIIAWKVPETLVRTAPETLVPTAAETRGGTALETPVRTAPGASPGGPGAAPARRVGLRTPLTDRIFLAFVALTFAHAVITAQNSTVMPLAMRADGLSSSAYGLVVALGGLFIVIGQLFVPRLIDGRRKHRVLATALGLAAFGYAGLAVADGLPGYLLAALVWTVGAMLAAPPNAEINAELAPPRLRGRYQAVFFLTFPAAAFVAPAVGGASLQYLGDGHWLAVAALGLLAVAGHLLAGPPRERRVARVAASPAVVSDPVRR
ncbi:MFS transporter [Plantactinospora sp. KLBMP9567]|uniref:MFS transporter n=1 Tax=Plantactinospora sp. KLBMP9567 TaxID=3085900 RepID=UPI0029823EF3|nr:MFS transporter [Plantactinospora sp. KLBMP9567]MDW5323023.1 MFS transporter [Plantactinospora sp. KLBMP9567]